MNTQQTVVPTDKYADQSRWNAEHGTLNLDEIKKSPTSFFVDIDSLAQHKKDIISKLGDMRGKRVLELGSGRGEFTVALAKCGAEVVGVDVGDDLVKLGREVASVNDVKCEFVCASIDNLGLPSNSFDFVVGNAILHHLSEEGVVQSLKETRRVLKPGGEAMFFEPIENSRVFDFIQNLFPAGVPGTRIYRPSILNRKQWSDYLDRVDDRTMTDKELVAAGEGFEKVDFEYYGLIIRLYRLFRNSTFRKVLIAADRLLTHPVSPIKKLSRSVLVTYS